MITDMNNNIRSFVKNVLTNTRKMINRDAGLNLRIRDNEDSFAKIVPTLLMGCEAALTR